MELKIEGFNGSWGWYRHFKLSHGLGSMLLHGKGAEIDKDDPELLAKKLNDLYDTIDQYDLENVYNMNETGLFFRTLPQHAVMLPDEGKSTTQGR